MTTLDPGFFADMSEVKAGRNTFGTSGRPNWRPSSAMLWYDGIIDDLLSNPGTTVKDIARRLGRSPGTVGMVMNSDLFKARYAQRREAFNEQIAARLTSKLVKVAEVALDNTLVVMEKKKDTIPLPLLNDIAKSSLDRLGYGPSRNESPLTPAINVSVTNSPVTVSPEALARAREHLRTLQMKDVSQDEQKPPAADPVAGRDQ